MFDERLKSLRKKCGYTQVSLAETLGVSKGTVAIVSRGWDTIPKELLLCGRLVNVPRILKP